tara:strand:+ start:66 stop:269 length:204 start_codon:yes stop_codon:yes gene_type:complete
MFPQISHLIIFSLEDIKDSAKGTINCSLWFNRCNAALLADLGPNPGNLLINKINLSISIFEDLDRIF